MSKISNNCCPTPYDAEKVYGALCAVARDWESKKTSKAFTEPSVPVQESIVRLRDGAATSVLLEDWSEVRAHIARLPMEILEDIPDFAWNVIHLANSR